MKFLITSFLVDWTLGWRHGVFHETKAKL